MSGISGVSSGAGAADLMKVLEDGQKAEMDMAKKIIKIANAAQVSESEATGLGQALDLYA